jgi:hypothetical protein
MDFTDDPEVRDQLLIGAILLFRGNVTILLPFGVPLSTGKVRPAGGPCQKAQRKDAPSSAPACSREFLAHEFTDDTK